MPEARLAEPWRSFLADIDSQLTQRVDLHCLGGFVVADRYDISRTTADLDVLQTVTETSQSLTALAGRGTPLHKKHKVYIDVVAMAIVPESYEARLTELHPHTFRQGTEDGEQRLTALSKLLKVAAEWGAIERMPCTVKLLKSPGGSMVFWDFDEYARLITAAAQIDTGTLVTILLGGDAGLRAGEIRVLEWTDLDFVKRQIRVERSDWRGQVGSTKGNRVRYVPMTARLSQALQRHRHLQSPRVLCEATGTPLRANGLAYLVERAVRKAGLAGGRKPRGAGPHVLRHTFCSHLAMRGAPARAVQKLAGHRDLGTTQRYMHLCPLAIEQAIRLLELPLPAQTPEVFGEILETSRGRKP